MALPFPNVPAVPGVPALPRPVGFGSNLSQLVGSMTGTVTNTTTGAFVGNIVGSIIQPSGLSVSVNGALNGTIDSLKNVAATMTGVIGGSAVGVLVGSVTGGAIFGSFGGSITQLTGDVGLLSPATGDAVNLPSSAAAPQWGIFKDGSAAIVGDNVMAVEYMAEYRISDFPVEGGKFESYNKVKVPYDARVTFTKGGTVADRTAFLNSIDTAIASLDLYTVVTPEVQYANANIVRYDYRRTSQNGVQLITAEVFVQEVRVAPEAQFSNTAQPAAADPVNNGAVQAQQPSTANFDLANLALKSDLF